MEKGNIFIYLFFFVVAVWEACSGKAGIGNNLKIFLNTERNQDT